MLFLLQHPPSVIGLHFPPLTACLLCYRASRSSLQLPAGLRCGLQATDPSLLPPTALVISSVCHWACCLQTRADGLLWDCRRSTGNTRLYSKGPGRESLRISIQTPGIFCPVQLPTTRRGLKVVCLHCKSWVNGTEHATQCPRSLLSTVLWMRCQELITTTTQEIAWHLAQSRCPHTCSLSPWFLPFKISREFDKGNIKSVQGEGVRLYNWIINLIILTSSNVIRKSYSHW